MNKRGVSPIIATILLVSIVVALGGIVSIWVNSESQSAMNVEGERRERIADRKNERLHLANIDVDNDILTVVNTGASDSLVTYVLINNTEYTSLDPLVDLRIGQHTNITTVILPDDVNVVEIGTKLGNLFVFTAPSAVIVVESALCDSPNMLYVLDGTQSTDPNGYIVLWEWELTDGSYTLTYMGQRVTVDFPDNTSLWEITLTVTDETGMSNSATISGFKVCQ